ncbi:MAG: hypothetical protein UW71_C0002G0002 [Parcubacteria group bacterium GW2011_GWB1_44_7]|nr:MAG: hypothetical protein UW71_C0002G0002 [Parcubacteria group bacterium GW2011_GWB1_44_7]
MEKLRYCDILYLVIWLEHLLSRCSPVHLRWIREECRPAQGWSASGRSGKKAFCMFYYVYILKSLRTGKLYKGFTGNLRARIDEHNSGKTDSTRTGGPWGLIYYEAFLNKSDALREEKFLKSGKGKERIKYLFQKSSNVDKEK